MAFIYAFSTFMHLRIYTFQPLRISVKAQLSRKKTEIKLGAGRWGRE